MESCCSYNRGIQSSLHEFGDFNSSPGYAFYFLPLAFPRHEFPAQRESRFSFMKIHILFGYKVLFISPTRLSGSKLSDYRSILDSRCDQWITEPRLAKDSICKCTFPYSVWYERLNSHFQEDFTVPAKLSLLLCKVKCRF